VFVGSMTSHRARLERRCLPEVGWYSRPKIHGSVAGPANIHQIECFGPDPVVQLVLVQHRPAWDLVLAGEE
jgi:hypothetical protein